VSQKQRVEEASGGDGRRSVQRRTQKVATTLFTTIFGWGTRVVASITIFPYKLSSHKYWENSIVAKRAR
jgi:hypothetical protein